MNKTSNDSSFINVNLPLPKKDKEIDNSTASFYALQVALQTMKERCQQLQHRLSVVEDENLRLRIENQKSVPNASSEDSGEINALKEHIAQLTRQKSQLTHHIYMVATENKQLWTRLSKLTEANQSLGCHLTKISDTLNKHSLGESSKPNQSIQIMNSCEKQTVDTEQKDASLEEISLKIISSIIREKIELEQQCDQMSALQTGTLSVQDCDFALSPDADAEQEELRQDLRRIHDSLRDQRDQLVKQQAGLRATLACLTNVVKNGILCKKCREAEKTPQQYNLVNGDHKQKPLINNNKLDDITSVSEPPADEGDNLVPGLEFEYREDRICPLCSRFFHQSTKFEEFHSHVLTHFSDEDADFESLVTTNYEIVN